MKQTAVEWLVNELANSGLLVTKEYKNLVAYKKAIEMEKKQMKEYEHKREMGYVKKDNQTK